MGINTPNIPAGSGVYELLGNETVAGKPSTRRFSRASVLAAFMEMQAGGGVAFSTKAQADANLLFPPFQQAAVWDDTADRSGIYQKTGPSGTGSWTRVGDLPVELIRLNVTGGTGDAITASMLPATPLNPADKAYILLPTASNTGAVTINEVPVKSALGSPLAENSLVAGVPVIMIWGGDHYQLVVSLPADTAGVVADAVAARDAALAAAASVSMLAPASRTALKAINTAVSKAALLLEAGRQGQFVWTAGDFSALVAADTQEGMFIKANGVSASVGAWVRINDSGGVNVVSSFGVDNTGGSVTLSLLQAASDVITAIGGEIYLPAGVYDLGGGQWYVADNSRVRQHPKAILRRTADPANPYVTYGSPAGSMVSLGNNVLFSGGQFDCTVVTTQSPTSFNIGTTPSKVFTVGTGLPINTGDFMRGYSRANGANHFEALVNSYNTATGALDLNVQFIGGSGTFTDWNFNFANVWHSPMVLHSVTGTSVDNIIVTGNWYVGPTMEAWNPGTGGTLLTSFCSFRDFDIKGVQNRGIYLYGRVWECLIEGNFIDCRTGTTDYGLNANPANATGNANSQVRNKIVDNAVRGAAFQSYEIGDICLYCQLNGNSATDMTQPGALGLLIQFANGQQPSDTMINGFEANNIPGTAVLIVGANFTNGNGISVTSCGTGISVQSSGGVGGTRNTLNGIQARACTTGVSVTTGATNTIVAGLSIGNTTNLVTSGSTNTVSTNLVTV